MSWCDLKDAAKPLCISVAKKKIIKKCYQLYVVGDQRTESREERALCFFVHWKGTLEGTLSFIYH